MSNREEGQSYRHSNVIDMLSSPHGLPCSEYTFSPCLLTHHSRTAC